MEYYMRHDEILNLKRLIDERPDEECMKNRVCACKALSYYMCCPPSKKIWLSYVYNRKYLFGKILITKYEDVGDTVYFSNEAGDYIAIKDTSLMKKLPDFQIDAPYLSEQEARATECAFQTGTSTQTKGNISVSYYDDAREGYIYSICHNGVQVMTRTIDATFAKHHLIFGDWQRSLMYVGRGNKGILF